MRRPQTAAIGACRSSAAGSVLRSRRLCRITKRGWAGSRTGWRPVHRRARHAEGVTTQASSFSRRDAVIDLAARSAIHGTTAEAAALRIEVLVNRLLRDDRRVVPVLAPAARTTGELLHVGEREHSKTVGVARPVAIGQAPTSVDRYWPQECSPDDQGDGGGDPPSRAVPSNQRGAR